MTLRVVVCICLILGCGLPAANAQQDPSKRLLLIGIDGLRPDALKAAATPFLDRLIQDGCLAETTQILGTRYRKSDTTSGPGWSSFLTGVWADKHGVHDNSFEGKNYRQYPHFFARIKQQYPTAQTGSFVDWEPIDQHIVSHADVRRVYPSKDLDSWARNDAKISRVASYFLATEEATATVAYFGTVDETGHRFGFHPSAQPYLDAIEVVDRHVGQLLSAIRNRPTYESEDWLVVVSTDHAGRGMGHSGGYNDPEISTTFLIVSGPSAQKGRIESQTYLVDAPVTALAHLGVAIDPQWNLDGRAVGLKP